MTWRKLKKLSLPCSGALSRWRLVAGDTMHEGSMDCTTSCQQATPCMTSHLPHKLPAADYWLTLCEQSTSRPPADLILLCVSLLRSLEAQGNALTFHTSPSYLRSVTCNFTQHMIPPLHQPVFRPLCVLASFPHVLAIMQSLSHRSSTSLLPSGCLSSSCRCPGSGRPRGCPRGSGS